MKIHHTAFIVVIALAMSLLVGCVSMSQGDSPPEPPFEFQPLSHGIFCPAGLHHLPDFTAEEVLALRLVTEIRKIPSADGQSLELQPAIALQFPRGDSQPSKFSFEELNRRWATSNYKVIVIDATAENSLVKPSDLPLLEKTSTLSAVRFDAMYFNAPLVILCGVDADAPALPGIPPGLRQFWQCPKCAEQQWRHHREAREPKWKPIYLLTFPLNLVPNMVVGCVGGTALSLGYLFYALPYYSVTDPAAFVLSLPALIWFPLKGCYFGFKNAWYGMPFWRMEKDWFDGGLKF